MLLNRRRARVQCLIWQEPRTLKQTVAYLHSTTYILGVVHLNIQYKKKKKKKIKNKKAHTGSVNIAAGNIRSLSYSWEEDYSTLKCTPSDKRPLLVKEAKRLHIDVLCLSETKLLGQDDLEINCYLLVWSGQEDVHQSGVAHTILRQKLVSTLSLTKPFRASRKNTHFLCVGILTPELED
jgi:hypothetical protein